MKIARIETFLVPPRFLLCRVETDDGIVGWGEPVVEGRAEVVAAAVEAGAETLIGTDPRRVEHHWQVLTKGGFYRGGPVLSSAVAGIDQALWDITGKAYGAPVHALLGGHVRDAVRMYAWAHGDDDAAVTDAAKARVEQGYTAVKLAPVRIARRAESPRRLEAMVETVAAVRDAVGDDVDVMVDLHGRSTLPLARQLLAELEPLGCLFVEEPVRPELSARLGALVAATSLPLATGERLYSRHEFHPVLEAGVAVVQPDVSHAGGISEVMRIAALADLFDASLAPHCPLGPVALAACLQVDLAVPNFLIQEHALDLHAGSGGALDWLVDTSVLRLTDGRLNRLTGPGLGIEIDDAAIRKAAAGGHRYRSPRWSAEDGGFAEW